MDLTFLLLATNESLLQYMMFDFHLCLCSNDHVLYISFNVCCTNFLCIQGQYSFNSGFFFSLTTST